VGDFVFAPPCAQTRRGVVEKADGAESCNFPTNFMPLNFFNERGIFCPKFCIFGGKLQKKQIFWTIFRRSKFWEGEMLSYFPLCDDAIADRSVVVTNP